VMIDFLIFCGVLVMGLVVICSVAAFIWASLGHRSEWY